MQVEFLENKKYSPNGYDIKESAKGDKETLSEKQAKTFIAQKICKEVKEKKK